MLKARCLGRARLDLLSRRFGAGPRGGQPGCMPTGTVTDARSGCVATRVAGGVAPSAGSSLREGARRQQNCPGKHRPRGGRWSRAAGRPSLTWPACAAYGISSDYHKSGQEPNFYVKQHLGLADFRVQSYEATEKWVCGGLPHFRFLQWRLNHERAQAQWHSLADVIVTTAMNMHGLF